MIGLSYVLEDALQFLPELKAEPTDASDPYPLSDVVAILDRHAREGERADPEAIARALERDHAWSPAAAGRAALVWQALYQLREMEQLRRRLAARRARSLRRPRRLAR